MGRKKISTKELAGYLGITDSRVRQKLADNIWDSISELTAISDHTGYSFNWLAQGIGPEPESEAMDALENKKHFSNVVNENPLKYLQGKSVRPLAVTVDRSGNELITYVPVRAQAGYQKGHADAHYIERLPAFSLPILKTGSYRMFEVDGDSMTQLSGGGLRDGDIVIAQYVEDITSIRDNRVYVIISKEGVIVKRCLNRLKEKENPILVCKSDNLNGQYPHIIIRADEIIEVWELKAFISKQLSFGTDMWQMLNDVEVKLALMEDKIKRIEEQKLMP